MFFTLSIIRKIKNVNYKGYVWDKLKYKLENDDLRHAGTVLEFLKVSDREIKV